MSPKLEIRGLGKTFKTRSGELKALEDVNFEIAENEFVSLVGTSGCGKSTLLNIVAGLDHPTEGGAWLDGEPITGPGRDRGMVFQSYTLLPWLNTRQNVEFALRGEDMTRAERRDAANQQLELVGLSEFGDAFPSQLSGGMRQRVAIARALSYRPEVLLMDEPFGALDALTRRVMQELLTEVWERHRLTVLFITHDVEEAIYISDRVLVMKNRPGKIKEEVEIDLPRPRDFAMISGGHFAELSRRVLEPIHMESKQVVQAAE
jgi:NitT/TauT family transport system ATP-binding protein